MRQVPLVIAAIILATTLPVNASATQDADSDTAASPPQTETTSATDSSAETMPHSSPGTPVPSDSPVNHTLARDNDDSVSKLESLTKAVLLKEIDYDRFILRFRKEVGRQDKFKGWRYFLSQQTNFSLSLAASIVSVHSRMGNIHKTDHPSRMELKHAAAMREIGSLASIAGSGLELAILEGRRYWTYKRGWTPGLAKLHIWQLNSEVNQLFSQREDLIQQERADPNLTVHAEIAEAEGKVLEDIHQLLIAEYRNYHLDNRRYMAFQQSLYTLDMIKRGLGAVAAGLSYRSQRLNDRTLNMPLGLLDALSGSFVIATPILSRELGRMAMHHHDRYLKLTRRSRDDIAAILDRLHDDRQAMRALVAANLAEATRLKQRSAERLALYESADRDFINEISQGLKQERKGVLAATENILAGLFSGSTTLVSGLTETRAGYCYTKNGPVSNALIGAGATTNLPGNAFAFGDNMRIQFMREWQTHRLRARHLLPNQLIDDRLAQLDKLEQQIRAKP